ncbi:MAG TPA: LamG-like jellyroll fold domain-containing protein, partial [Clostridia bacterium]|nr:LamG-like jellyroll fold domain-containing protein [Clostridia bacterium]
MSAPSYGPGKVGTAFAFSGSSSGVRVPASSSLDVGQGSGMTLEGWINPSETTSHPIAEWVIPGTYGVHFFVSAGNLYLNLFGTDGNSRVLETTGAPLVNNSFQHVAFTYDKGTGIARLFLNGALVAESAVGSFTPKTSSDLSIGYRPSTTPFGPNAFVGSIDELSLYSRALSPSELQAIYTADSDGKCSAVRSPLIYSQPQSQTVVVGGAAQFDVLAGGTAPLAFQWKFNGTNLAGATTSSLVLTQVQNSDAGEYSVVITNIAGSAVSSNAVLTVVPAPPCAASAPELVGWWAGENTASDAVGSGDGTFLNGEAYAPAKVGLGFRFNGKGNHVLVPATPRLDVGKADGMTVEAWIAPSANNNANPIVEWAPSNGSSYGVHFYVSSPNHGVLYANLYGIDRQGHVVQTGEGAIVPGKLQHVALTYSKSSGMARLFVNGNLAQETFLGTFTPQTSAQVYIGHRPSTIANGPYSFDGIIDEVSVYARSLSAAEIQAVYTADASGKCAASFPPSIFAQPADKTTAVGQTVNLTVGASGYPPPTYQWAFNGIAVEGATGPALGLTNVQKAQQGVYSVAITNDSGWAISSNAVLTVNFPPANIRIANTATDAGVIFTVPITLLANGNENALAFSMNFSSALLSFAKAELGTGATGASLVLNTNQVANGKLGVLLSLESGKTFNAGTQEVLQVSFQSAVLSHATDTPLSFGDQPTKRQLVDAQARLLGSAFTGGTVSIAAAMYEGDLSPRPNGDKDVTATDWVLAGLYVARLEYPTNAGEFQRADCAPRSTSGDGYISVGDWVQAGRYAAGLDPMAVAGGPTAEVEPHIQMAVRRSTSTGTDASRQVKVGTASSLLGQTVTVPVCLESLGNENAVGLSLSFDPTSLTYTSTKLGSNSTGATLNINTTQAGLGRIALVLALPPGSSFTNGTKELATVTFRATAPVPGTFAISLSD